MPRFYVDTPLSAGTLELPERAARHAQVLRLQPGSEVTLFDGSGGEWQARVTDMKRRVAVELLAFTAIEREANAAVHLAVGMPANDNMDYLVEKATELGAASIQPLECERSTLRLRGERIAKKQAHWQSVAIAACEQCGRNRVPRVEVPLLFSEWITEQIRSATVKKHPRFVLSFIGAGLSEISTADSALFLSGPEGGLSPAEQQAALDAGFVAVNLGARVLRAETAPLVVLSVWGAAAQA
jgi:16S rRNA (uracil1498-N3)-methyltransferase